ncbi:MAG: response regulator transcription factor [Dehalococcoidia bacterium]|jgi:DNA-binding response OmpR family regulator|uniref:OmpR/PhoB-type domain-containing protein n=1 Tax=marine metagenome TaxID=408172 RepID=A0A381VQH5_9ZZZZ|nr:response regulator transcription factor [SAR202 cluster bacterium]MCS5649026.1 response regulator transcription factor [Dehalococcoidia bacterium]MEC7913359.1 response regulator transcription factor [Chloroflexota bacterium]HAT21884.1 DNA-binding response regulator [Dehalococcoidia bacterium]HBR65765.1 DNA-binding response regulator [Dehalococcoidia bacterium]|tara:strand:- start:11532 stop:12215 length:684 start_codon:yes stop_codon:yes gene_type:complete
MNIAHNKPNELTREDICQLLAGDMVTPIFVSNSNESETFIDQVDTAKGSPLIIIDLGLLNRPQISRVLELCKEKNLPTLAIISPDDLMSLDTDMINTDFIVAPLLEEELIVRSMFSVKKATITPEEEELINRGDLTINPSNYEVLIKNSRVNLRFKEYELLLLLASNPGRVYDRATLLNQIWGYDYFGGTRTVDVHIRRLRSKIENNSESPYIETIWNVGYRFRSSN